MKDLRKEICEALAEIPILLAITHRALGVFRKSKELHKCSASLYTATIAALRHIVEWYEEKALSKIYHWYRSERRRLINCSEKISKSFFKQSLYEEKLDDLIQAVKTQSQSFEDCARLCSYETIRHTDDTVRSHQKYSRVNHKELVGQLKSMKIDQFDQNNLIGQIVVTEAGNIQRMVTNRFNEMSDTMIKELKETIVKETLENFLSSGNLMDFRTQDGQLLL